MKFLKVIVWAVVFTTAIFGLVYMIVYVYPDPTLNFGRSTVYKWQESDYRWSPPKTVHRCFVWEQKPQAWKMCESFDRKKLNSLGVEWSDQSVQVKSNLPPE